MNRWLRLTRRGALCTRWPSIGPALLPGGPASLIGHREKHSGLKAEYEALVAAGKLTFDPHQLRAVEHLQRLQRELDGYQPAQSPSLFQQLFISRNLNRLQQKRITGLYMYGSVGSGKTMLMDLFYKATRVARKQRVHFNSFMLDVHNRIHHFKKTLPRVSGRDKPHAYDPIAPVARDIASRSHLLCFDELQVTDIADAMILRGLFSTLFESGVVVVATSNRAPDDLYKNGLQRSNFLPFIDILKVQCSVLHLDSQVDYRSKALAAAGQVYLTPNTADADRKLEEVFQDLAQEQDAVSGPRVLEFLGRKLVVPKAAGSLACFSFDELCARPSSAADYLELCYEFETLFIKDIPQLTRNTLTEARRFITLIDTLYDHKVKLVCTAAVPPDELFLSTSGRSDYEVTESRILMDDLDIKEGGVDSQASIFTGEEEIFAFQRTVSRLTEMQGEEYWRTNWVPPR